LKAFVIAATVAFAGTQSSLAAPKFILCQATDLEDVVLELESRTHEDKTLSCLSGAFITDMTPCAPDGGFGLSAPTGGAALVDVVFRWQDYMNHVGGVMSFASSPSVYHFEGGFAGPDTGLRPAWSFLVNRLTGEGKLSIVQEIEEDGSVGTSTEVYTCAAAERRF
jgi:hypothetical protein